MLLGFLHTGFLCPFSVTAAIFPLPSQSRCTIQPSNVNSCVTLFSCIWQCYHIHEYKSKTALESIIGLAALYGWHFDGAQSIFLVYVSTMCGHLQKIVFLWAAWTEEIQLQLCWTGSGGLCSRALKSSLPSVSISTGEMYLQIHRNLSCFLLLQQNLGNLPAI